jgi:hypothetical protein
MPNTCRTAYGRSVPADQTVQVSGLENRYGFERLSSLQGGGPFNSGTALLTKAFADLTATTGTPVC